MAFQEVLKFDGFLMRVKGGDGSDILQLVLTVVDVVVSMVPAVSDEIVPAAILGPGRNIVFHLDDSPLSQLFHLIAFEQMAQPSREEEIVFEVLENGDNLAFRNHSNSRKLLSL